MLLRPTILVDAVVQMNDALFGEGHFDLLCHPREREDPFVVATQVFTKFGFPRS